MMHVDYSALDNCKNLEYSFGEICVGCNKCGRFNRRKKPVTCYICGKPATILCDAPVRGNLLGTCNKPMCKEHAYRIDNDTDVCNEHYNELNIRAAKKNRKSLELWGWKQEVEHDVV